MSKKTPAVLPDPAEEEIPEKWTVMVFMGAETEDGNAPMIQPAIDDLVEMATVGSGRALNIHVQVHTRDMVYRARVDRRLGKALRSRGLAALPAVKKAPMHTGGPLADFMEDALKKSGHQAGNSKHCSMLVLWGHAYDFAIGKAPTTSGELDALDFVEIKDMLQRMQSHVRTKIRSSGAPKLDIVAFDACDVATAEVACELEPYADFLLGSQSGVPIPGWPYDDVLQRLREPYRRMMRPIELGTWIVGRFTESYASRRAASLSMLRLKRAGDLSDRISALAESLLRFIAHDPSDQELVAEIFTRSMTDFDKPYVDVADLCLNLVRECGDPLVHAAARTLGDFLIAPLADTSDDAPPGTTQFITANGRNAGETALLNGLSIYAPHLAPERDSVELRKLYEKFELSSRTAWPQLVFQLAG